MIETEQQRRWWFATHPEFSSRGHGKSRKGHRDDDESEKISPERVDAYVAERLAKETDPVIIQLLKSTEYWFGTEFASKSPAEQAAALSGDEEDAWDDNDVDDASHEDLWSQPSGHPAASRDSYDRYEDALDRADAYAKWLTTRYEKPLEADPHTLLDLLPYRRLITSPIEVLRSLLRNMAEGAVVSAVKKGASGGPGKWVEVARSPIGLGHQSRMSGQQIRASEGKLWIKEYELNGVKFDDYKNGNLYEYKGPQGNLINKSGQFSDWCRETVRAREQARGQADAARGIPVIWRVGENQVEAFTKAVGDIPGIFIVP